MLPAAAQAIPPPIHPPFLLHLPGIGPGGNISITDDVHTLGIDYQSVSLTGPPPATSANVGNGTPSQSFDGSTGFGSPNVPLVVFDDLNNGFFREWGGSGDPNNLATWKPTQPLGAMTEQRLATGPKGLVLMGKQPTGSTGVVAFVARRFDPLTDNFGPATPLSDAANEPDVIFRDTFEDAGGNVAAVWIANGLHGGAEDPMRYRVSPDGGVTWQAERTLLTHTDASGVDRAYNLQMGAAPDGGGFVAYDANDRGPLMAAPISLIAQQGLPAPVEGKSMNAAVISGKVLVKLPGTKKFVALASAGKQLPGSASSTRPAARCRLRRRRATGRRRARSRAASSSSRRRSATAPQGQACSGPGPHRPGVPLLVCSQRGRGPQAQRALPAGQGERPLQAHRPQLGLRRARNHVVGDRLVQHAHEGHRGAGLDRRLRQAQDDPAACGENSPISRPAGADAGARGRVIAGRGPSPNPR